MTEANLTGPFEPSEDVNNWARTNSSDKIALMRGIALSLDELMERHFEEHIEFIIWAADADRQFTEDLK